MTSKDHSDNLRFTAWAVHTALHNGSQEDLEYAAGLLRQYFLSPSELLKPGTIDHFKLLSSLNTLARQVTLFTTSHLEVLEHGLNHVLEKEHKEMMPYYQLLDKIYQSYWGAKEGCLAVSSMAPEVLYSQLKPGKHTESLTVILTPETRLLIHSHLESGTYMNSIRPEYISRIHSLLGYLSARDNQNRSVIGIRQLTEVNQLDTIVRLMYSVKNLDSALKEPSQIDTCVDLFDKGYSSMQYLLGVAHLGSGGVELRVPNESFGSFSQNLLPIEREKLRK